MCKGSISLFYMCLVLSRCWCWLALTGSKFCSSSVHVGAHVGVGASVYVGAHIGVGAGAHARAGIGSNVGARAEVGVVAGLLICSIFCLM